MAACGCGGDGGGFIGLGGSLVASTGAIVAQEATQEAAARSSLLIWLAVAFVAGWAVREIQA